MHQGPQPLMDNEANQQMKDVWTQDNDNNIATWNAQLEQDRVEAAEQDRLAQEQEENQRTQCEKEAEVQHKESEKKKPKLNSFDPTRQVSSWIAPRPAPYALNKINTLEYVELDYFTLRGC